MNNIENTLFIGKVLHHFPQLESTNLTATEWVSKNNPSEGTVISTYHQTGGRGQIGSRWESAPDKNLSFSLILYPTFLESRRQFLLSQTISLAVYDFLSHYISDDVRIKWPNDLYVADQKIGGMLIQNTLSGTNLQSSVIGIGINVLQKQFISDAPNPVSMVQLTDKKLHLDQLLGALCQQVEYRYLQLRGGAVATIKREYLDRLYRFNQPALYQRSDQTVFMGTITGIDDIGRLQIKNQRKIESFGVKEVVFR